MTKKNRIFAIILAVAIIFVMLFSGLFLVAQTHHECTSKHCSVCYQLSVCHNLLKTVFSAVIAVLFLAALICVARCVAAAFVQECIQPTLITLKVKLSN